jgi:AraC-like DNA-binding protein
MRRNDSSSAGSVPVAGPRRQGVARPLRQGQGWGISEYICTAGPHDRPFEERHEEFSIAAVLHPGAFLLGNSATCYECGHDHSTGDRCVSFHFSPAYFAEVAASIAGSGRFRFPAPMLPVTPKLLPWLVRIEARTALAERLEMDEAAPRLMEAVIGAVSGTMPLSVCVSARDRRRVGDALRYIERHAADALDLDTLAGVAIMSKYHFLRTFRHIVGMTPYQFVLSVRMRRAAVRLATSSAPVSAIAFETGFGDLSTFNGRFRDVFGMSPMVYRSRERAA